MNFLEKDKNNKNIKHFNLDKSEEVYTSLIDDIFKFLFTFN
jgi:hypothetical protein